MSKKISELSDASSLNGTEFIPIVQSSATVKTAIRPLRPYDAVIDARTDAQAGTALLNAVERLNADGQGGEVHVMAGAINLGTNTLVLSECVVMHGVASGWRPSYSNAKGTRLYWTGATNLGNCIQITGSGAGISNMMLDVPTTLNGDAVLCGGQATGIFKPHIHNVRIVKGPDNGSFWALKIRDCYVVSMRDVYVTTYANGILYDQLNDIYHTGNVAWSDIYIDTRSNNRIGMKFASPNATQRVNLMTINQLSAACTSGIGTGTIGLQLRGASRICFNGPDVENYETLLDLGEVGGAGSLTNSFINPYFNKSVFTLRNVLCDRASVGNTFVGGWIATPDGYSSSLQDDATRGTLDPNMYLHVRATNGYHPYP